MGMVFGICVVLALATFAPEIFATAVIGFQFMIRKLKSLWKQ